MSPTRRCWRDHLGKPLTAVPDPFGTHESYGAHNNARLKAFLDRFGFDYEFRSATDMYKSGVFDDDAAARAGQLREGDGRRCCRRWARSGARPIRPSCRSRRAPARCCRCRVAGMGRRPAAPSSIRGGRQRRRAFRSPAAIASCSGRPTGRCAGWRWASTTRCAGKDLICLGRTVFARSCASLGGEPPEGFELRAVPG